ncbi:MBL fold metallo-hydrolase [Actinomadura sp. 1N219]|uniref:MBL fold metallo-hydrolase n=1 Tax=Actinomadura sp. 1N219 TaxID=3375152 RepID=UPI00379E9C80
MELRFIGTGSILSDRMSASALVDGKLLIDTPNGSMKAMRRAGMDPTSVDICLITHFHADHFFDIVFLFLEQGIQHSRDRDLVLIGPTGFAERLEELFELAYPGTFADLKTRVPPRYVEFGEQGGDWSGDGYTITALPMQHTVPALGYSIVDESGARLGYTGDTVHCPSVEKLAGGSVAMAIDTSFPGQGKVGHMGLDDVEAVAGRWPDLPLLATHVSDDVTASSRPNILFPADGQQFTIDADGLHAAGN